MAVIPYGWEGNRRSRVALIMRDKLSGLSIYGLKGLRKGDKDHSYIRLSVCFSCVKSAAGQLSPSQL